MIMRILYCLFLLCAGVHVVKGQMSSIVVESKDGIALFYLMIDGLQMNDFYENHVTVNNLQPGRHKVRVVFEQDTVSDYVETINLYKNERRTYEVLPKSRPRKILDDTGRDAGEALKIGKHDSQYGYLVDSYHIKEKFHEPFEKTGDEIEIDTDKSTSTSILPASKSKPTKP